MNFDVDELSDELAEAMEEDQTFLALAICEKLLDSGEDSPWIHRLYATNLGGVGRYDAAIKHIDIAVELLKAKGKKYAWTISRKGSILKEKGDLRLALKAFLEAHQQKPDEASFLIFAATVSFRLGDVKQAEELARKGTECSKGHIDEAWYNLGSYLAAQANFEEAMECYEKAIEIDPDYEEANKRIEELIKKERLKL